MKTLPRFFALVTLSTFAFAPGLLHAQDVPPPPPDQGAPPPDQSYQGPPPDQGPPPQDQGDSQDDQGASFQTFYDQLGDQGQWVQTDNYGYVFQPNVSDPNWAPYSDGHWVYTDVGWTWVSAEPWGWATYHYGRWANIDGTGWVWVPGYRWAPAWVSWRYGGGYAGWAPLPPETFIGAEYGHGGVNVGIGFHFGSDVDVNFNIGPGCYNFVQVGYLGEPNYRGHYIDRSRNYTVINNTTNITNINVNHTTVINNYGANGAAANFRGVTTGGPSLAEVNAHAQTHVQTVQLTPSSQVGRSTLNGNSLAVYAPRVNPASQHTARPAQVSRTISHPTFNRGDSITKPLEVTSAVKPAAPSQEAIAAAREAQAKAPAKAHIANENTTIKTPITAPLTSMKPVEQIQHKTATTTPAAATSTTAKPTESHHDTSSAFTGETAKPAPPTHPQSEVAPRTETGGSAFTGEQQKPAQAYHPQTETTPVTHTQPVEKPAPTYHPQQEASPAPSYHPQTEERTAPVEHTVPPPQHESAPVVHAQSPPQHEAAPAQTHAAPAGKPSEKPAAQGGGDKNPGGNGGNPQGR